MTTYRKTLSLALASALVTLAGCPGDNQGGADMSPGPADQAAGADLTAPVVTVISGFKQPESAYFDPVGKFWYVSNIDGQPGMKDGMGSITRISADLKRVEHDWVTGLSSPAGLRSLSMGASTALFVADVDELVSINTENKMILGRQPIAITAGGFLNDVVVAGTDTFVTETLQNRIWRVPAVGMPMMFATDSMFNNPNGLFVDGNTLYMVAIGDLANPNDVGSLWKGDTGNGTSLMKFGSFTGKLDGIEKDGASLLISDFAKRTVSRIDLATGNTMAVVRDFTQDGLKSAADIGFDPTGRVLAVPDLNGNQVGFMTVN